MYDYSRVLPIGSVVLLKEANKRLMILGYRRASANDPTRVYDYCGCTYPEGFTSPQQTAIFDHDMIDRVIFMGLQNPAQAEFSEKLKTIIEKKMSK